MGNDGDARGRAELERENGRLRAALAAAQAEPRRWPGARAATDVRAAGEARQPKRRDDRERRRPGGRDARPQRRARGRAARARARGEPSAPQPRPDRERHPRHVRGAPAPRARGRATRHLGAGAGHGRVSRERDLQGEFRPRVRRSPSPTRISWRRFTRTSGVSAAEVEQAIKEEREFDIEYRCRWPDRTVHWINVRGDVLRIRTGPSA